MTLLTDTQTDKRRPDQNLLGGSNDPLPFSTRSFLLHIQEAYTCIFLYYKYETATCVVCVAWMRAGLLWLNGSRGVDFGLCALEHMNAPPRPLPGPPPPHLCTGLFVCLTPWLCSALVLGSRSGPALICSTNLHDDCCDGNLVKARVRQTANFGCETPQYSWVLPDLSPQQLPDTDENTPQPLVDGQSRAREGLPPELNDDDLRRRRGGDGSAG